jgi:hypothetical protein
MVINTPGRKPGLWVFQNYEPGSQVGLRLEARPVTTLATFFWITPDSRLHQNNTQRKHQRQGW